MTKQLDGNCKLFAIEKAKTGEATDGTNKDVIFMIWQEMYVNGQQKPLAIPVILACREE